MSARTPAPPPELPGFSFVELLGSGGFADVYKYTQLGLGRQVAVKVLTGDVSKADLAAFGSEANVMAQLSNHPSIVSIYQADITPEGRPYLVMEFCPPPHLGLRIRRRPLSVAKALEITVQLAGAVETAHRLGILHRDIKPANILFTEFGRPALTDFGISVTTHSGAAGLGVGMSIPWAPPEQLTTGSPMGVTADVYSMAATLWTALVGRSPFHVPGGNNDPYAMAPRVRQQALPPTRRPEVPESLERLLRTAMAKSPDERFSTVMEFARALQGVQAEVHHPVTPLEVRDEHLLGDGFEDEGHGGTKVTGFISIDPEVRQRPPADPIGGPGDSVGAADTADPAARAVFAAPRFTEPGPEATVISVAGSPTADTVTPDQAPARLDPTGSGDRAERPGIAVDPAEATSSLARRIGVAIGGAVVVTAGVAALLLGRDAGAADDTKGSASDPTSSTPVDPFGETVPSPSDVTVTRVSPTKIRVSWTDPAPQAGDTFAYKLIDPVNPRDWQVTAKTSEVLAAEPGRGCVLVVLQRANNGGSSESARACPEGDQ